VVEVGLLALNIPEAPIAVGASLFFGLASSVVTGKGRWFI